MKLVILSTLFIIVASLLVAEVNAGACVLCGAGNIYPARNPDGSSPIWWPILARDEGVWDSNNINARDEEPKTPEQQQFVDLIVKRSSNWPAMSITPVWGLPAGWPTPQCFFCETGTFTVRPNGRTCCKAVPAYYSTSCATGDCTVTPSSGYLKTSYDDMVTCLTEAINPERVIYWPMNDFDDIKCGCGNSAHRREEEVSKLLHVPAEHFNAIRERGRQMYANMPGQVVMIDIVEDEVEQRSFKPDDQEEPEDTVQKRMIDYFDLPQYDDFQSAPQDYDTNYISQDPNCQHSTLCENTWDRPCSTCQNCPNPETIECGNLAYGEQNCPGYWKSPWSDDYCPMLNAPRSCAICNRQLCDGFLSQGSCPDYGEYPCLPCHVAQLQDGRRMCVSHMAPASAECHCANYTQCDYQTPYALNPTCAPWASSVVTMQCIVGQGYGCQPATPEDCYNGIAMPAVTCGGAFMCSGERCYGGGRQNFVIDLIDLDDGSGGDSQSSQSSYPYSTGSGTYPGNTCRREDLEKLPVDKRRLQEEICQIQRREHNHEH